MEKARKIMATAPMRTLIANQNDPDYCGLLELRWEYESQAHDSAVLISMAFSLGHALGVRDERARRAGKTIQPPAPEEARAAEAVVEDEWRSRRLLRLLKKLDPVALEATLTTIKSMSQGKTNEEAIKAGNDILARAGRKQMRLPVAG